MSIVKINDKHYLRVDWTLGSSKNNAINFYSQVLEYLKEKLQNSHMVIIILEYMKHMPLYAYYELPRPENGNYFKKCYLQITSRNDNFNNYDTKQSGLIEDEKFVFDFMRLVVDKDQNNFADSSIHKENILYLFSKHAIKTQLVINKTYYIYNSLIRSIPKYQDHKYLYTVTVMIEPNSTDINNTFGVAVQRILNKYNICNIHLEMNIDIKNYINNMYYMVNFSNNREYNEKGTEFIHPFFQNIIKENFPEFYNALSFRQRIKIYNNKLTLFKSTVNRICDEDDGRQVYTEVPDELNNVFIKIKHLFFKSMYVNDVGCSVNSITISLRKN
jgi:hypothetical protein